MAGWCVDGSLSVSPRWAEDPRMVAISKSHPILPFGGDDLEQYLRLPWAHRSSIYAPATRSLAPVRAWGLRLWPWEGKDLLHGLVRVEVAPANGSTEQASGSLAGSWRSGRRSAPPTGVGTGCSMGFTVWSSISKREERER